MTNAKARSAVILYEGHAQVSASVQSSTRCILRRYQDVERGSRSLPTWARVAHEGSREKQGIDDALYCLACELAPGADNDLI